MPVTYTITRTGDRPLAFEGQRITSASSEGPDGPANLRWHEVSLYSLTGSQELVLAISYRTKWAGESDHHAAYVCQDAPDAAGWLRSYDPLAYLIGPPSGGPGSPQEQRQARLQRDLRLRYDNVVSDVLSHLEPERI